MVHLNVTEENKRIVKASIQKRSSWHEEPHWIRRCNMYNCTMDEVLDIALADPEWWTMDNVSTLIMMKTCTVTWYFGKEKGVAKGMSLKKQLLGRLYKKICSIQKKSK